ncbi:MULTISPECIES: DUF6893 family small protein [unclassified Streptomyces]
MKKVIICGASAVVVVCALGMVFPDIQRYLRIRRM